jgi:hypothetical protein
MARMIQPHGVDEEEVATVVVVVGGCVVVVVAWCVVVVVGASVVVVVGAVVVVVVGWAAAGIANAHAAPTNTATMTVATAIPTA